MTTTLVTLNTVPRLGTSRSVVVPLAIPDLDDVRALAAQLHARGESYQERVWGWQVTYEPESKEAEAAVEFPDDRGGFATQKMPLWAPASFTIGENGVWFFSLLWENGIDQPPVEFLDDGSYSEND